MKITGVKPSICEKCVQKEHQSKLSESKLTSALQKSVDPRFNHQLGVLRLDTFQLDCHFMIVCDVGP